MDPAAQPLLFEPIFQERVWGGRKLERAYGKKLPPEKAIGESWEVVDREEAQSVVRQGPWRGRTLHELWREQHDQIFGAAVVDAPRFPILAKLLDARDRLSLQVHPPPEVADALGGDPKSEMWYLADAEPGAEIFAGLRAGTTRARFEQALREGKVNECLHRLPVQKEDAIYIPSGRLHAIGAGCLIVEIQQNSDTTYRVFDWNRGEAEGKSRELHTEEAMRSINFDDFEPALMRPEEESLLRSPKFGVEKWELSEPRRALDRPVAAVFFCVRGELQVASVPVSSGEFFLVPARATEATLEPGEGGATVLCVRLPTR